MQYQCKACGHEFGEDDPTPYTECPHCKSTKEWLKNKTRSRITNLEGYVEGLEKEVWKLQERVKELELVSDDGLLNEDIIRPMVLEYVQGFVSDYVKEWKNLD